MRSLTALANGGNRQIELTRRTYEEALENEFSIDLFHLLIEAHIDQDTMGIGVPEELLKENPIGSASAGRSSRACEPSLPMHKSFGSGWRLPQSFIDDKIQPASIWQPHGVLSRLIAASRRAGS